MTDQFLEAWQIHNHILQDLIGAVTDEALSSASPNMKSRSVAEILAHIHNNRLAWIEPAAPDRMTALARIPVKSKADKAALGRKVLSQSLQASSEVMAAVLEAGFTRGKISGFAPHAAAFYTYLTAHEWYHIGEICMTLTQAGHRLPDDVLYGLWDWKKR